MLGEGACCGPVSASPPQAPTSLWWQECGHHGEAQLLLLSLAAQGLAPGSPRALLRPLQDSHRELAWQHIPAFFILILLGPHTYNEIHSS